MLMEEVFWQLSFYEQPSRGQLTEEVAVPSRNKNMRLPADLEEDTPTGTHSGTVAGTRL